MPLPHPLWAVRVLAPLLLGLTLTSSSFGQGSTIITHGYQVDASLPDWPADLGSDIIARAGIGGTVFVYQPTTSTWNLQSGTGDPSGEWVFVFNWAEDSAWFPGVDNHVGTAVGAGEALATALRGSAIPGGVADNWSALQGPTPQPRRLHFLGHSRGAAVNTRAMQRVLSWGFLIDQATTLDPHPIDGPSPNLFDPIPVTFEGVTWADNYWRADGCDFDEGCLGFDFDGREVAGALNVNLGFLDAMDPFDNRLNTCSLEHTLLHSWYQGTVDLAASGDLSCNYDRSNWYTDAGASEGYFYAVSGGGSNQRPCGPDGGCADAGRAPVPLPAPLFNGDFEWGAGQDTGWRWHGGGGLGLIVEEAGNTHLELDSGASSRIHDYFFVAPNANRWSFRYRVISADTAGDDALTLTLERGSATFDLGTVPITTATPWTDVEWTVPAVAPGSYRLIVGLAGGASIASIITVDDLTYDTANLFRRGDCNGDDNTGLPDGLSLLNYLFLGGVIGCAKACDSNDDGDLELIDAIVLLQYLFSGGAPLPSPSPDCGVESTPDSLSCEISSCP